eukprot:13193086-Alexandrium_andersonii.AAC.1
MPTQLGPSKSWRRAEGKQMCETLPHSMSFMARSTPAVSVKMERIMALPSVMSRPPSVMG